MRRAAWAVLLLAAAAAPARPRDFSRAAVGTSGAEFLLMDAGARGIALGGAMAAATSDAASLYWNPAGLARVPRLSATFMHAQHVADVSYDAAAAATRLGDSTVLGAGVRYLDGGEIARTNINGVETGSFHPRAFVLEGGWAQAVPDLSDSETDVTMGISGKALRSDLGETANAFGGDLGVQARFYLGDRAYDIGAAVQNVGSGTKFDQTRDTLPTRLRAGACVRPMPSLLLAAEALAPVNGAPNAAAGLEWGLEMDRAVRGALRAGVNTLTADSLGVASALSFGFGVAASDFSFDYAFVPTGALGGTSHRVSVSFNLPAKASRRARARR